MNFLLQKTIYPKLALCLAILFIFNIFLPTLSYALTSGPTQPEVQSFSPAGTSDMVDPFSGDFSYNIPLLELPGPNGGYPFNLSYQAGVGMDQEASWVGLGWNLNVGAINRQVRGLPDEFKGDKITTKESMKDNITVGVEFSPQMKSELLGKYAPELSASLYYNNYKGLGISYGISSSSASSNNDKVAALSASLSLNNDSQSGASMNTGVSLSIGKGRLKNKLDAGIGYSSASGLSDLNLGLRSTYNTQGIRKYGFGFGAKASASISFSNKAYLPSINSPMQTGSWNLSAKIGLGSVYFPNATVKGYYNYQNLKYKGKDYSVPSYGYLYSEQRTDESLADFNREKDGVVTKETPFIGSPQLTYDIYSVQAQGISAMYRPWRSDMGIISDEEQEEKSRAKTIGADFSPVGHVGVHGVYSPTTNASGLWNNNLTALLGFQTTSSNKLYEPYYFAPVGEMTSLETNEFANIGSNEAIRAKLSWDANSLGLENNAGNPISISNTNNSERKARNLSVLPMKNEYIKSNPTILPEYNTGYYNASEQLVSLDRSKYPDHHLAGITSTTAEGMRYVFGLPAYINEQKDYQFTVVNGEGCSSNVDIDYTGQNADKSIIYEPNQTTGNTAQKLRQTNQYFKSTTTPAHPHAFLLTSVLGSDYVDSDGIAGVTPDDEGYHVNFGYKKVSDNYRWRAPYYGANYSDGYKYTIQDNQGNFTTGTKEIFYIHKAETKSHVAIFTITPRKDGHGAAWEIQNRNSAGAQTIITDNYSYKLDKIDLYTRDAYENLGSGGVPIKTVSFKYDYSLCPKTDNNFTGEGKLTLTEINITYGDSQKGTENPYKFVYGGENPSYDTYSQDRWGNYKPFDNANRCIATQYPYAEQDREKADKYASSWNLTTIKLPSGGEIEVTYEADDYGYVQNKTAMQMNSITAVGGTQFVNGNNILNDTDYRVYFELETPLAKSAVTDTRKEAERYVDLETNQLYFNLNLNLRVGVDFYEQVRGYADIANYDLYDDGSSTYKQGYIEVKPINISGKNIHPFTLAGWQHIKYNQPELMAFYKDHPDKGNILDQIKSIVAAITLTNIIVNFYERANEMRWSRQLKLDKSWIRLNTPDLEKIGGGHRVKQIVYKDNWEYDGGKSIYGQVYSYDDYSKELGKNITTGVATYEPMVGADENALRYAKKYTKEHVGLKDEYMHIELPINESYFPGASVGYGKVTVRSLANAVQENIAGVSFPSYFPTGIFSTSATSVSEFYTAKDYPIITSYTDKKIKESKGIRYLAPIGISTLNRFMATQGFVIELNNMHGKPKRSASYPQEKGQTIWDKPINWTEYYYQNDKRIVKGKEINVLNNTCKTLRKDDGAVKLDTKNRLLGLNYEFFGDSRSYNTKSRTYGIEGNVDVVVPYFIPTALPDHSGADVKFTSIVFNKIIHRSGIISSVKAYDGSAVLETKNLLWDAQTGQVLLTQVNNNFDNPLFSYTILAHTQYEGMGPAFKNIGLDFTITGATQIPPSNLFRAFIDPTILSQLSVGDEFIVNKGHSRAVLMSHTGNQGDFYIENAPQNFSSMNLFLYRSGRRNLLSAPAANITALKDPTSSEEGNRQRVNAINKFQIPVGCH